jgi:hypothetical protein
LKKAAVVLLLDPTCPPMPVVALLGAAVALLVLPALLPPRG